MKRITLLVAPVLAYLVAAALVFSFEVDDAYISLRYAENLAAGRGLVWNPGGPRLESYTNFLLVLVEAALAAAGARGLTPVKLFCVAMGGLLVAGVAIHARRRIDGEGERAPDGWIPALCAWTVASSAPFLLWSVGGLETIPFASLVGLGTAIYVQHMAGQLRGARVVLADAALVAATLMRPEGLLFWGAAALDTLVARARGRREVASPRRMASLIAGAFVLVGYGVWKKLYFGALLPATWLAKEPQVGLKPVLLGAGRLLRFLLLDANILLLGVIIAGIAAAARRRLPWRAPLWFLSATAAAYAAYVISLGPKVPMDDAFRFHVPLVPLFALLLVEVAVVTRRRAPPAVVAVVVLALALLRGRDLHQAWTADLNWGAASYRVAARDIAQGLQRAHVALGRWLGEHSPEGATVVLHDAGAIAYHSGLRTIDTWSLTDPHMLALRREARAAPTEAARAELLAAMRAYVQSKRPEYVAQDELGLREERAFLDAYRPTGMSFVYLDRFECAQREPCRYAFELWQRRDLPLPGGAAPRPSAP